MKRSTNPLVALAVCIVCLGLFTAITYYAWSIHYWPPLGAAVMFLIGAFLAGRNAVRYARG